jgi:hypothetical protein
MWKGLQRLLSLLLVGKTVLAATAESIFLVILNRLTVNVILISLDMLLIGFLYILGTGSCSKITPQHRFTEYFANTAKAKKHHMYGHMPSRGMLT